MKNIISTNNARRRVGFFDSGHGGLGLLQEAMSRQIDADFLYFADLEYLPYGDKTEKFVIQRCSTIVDFLISKGCTAIVVACNTATAISIDAIRQRVDIPIIGVEPYINYINKVPQDNLRAGTIGALVTPGTFKSERLKFLQQKHDPDGRVQMVPMPGLALAVEDLISSRCFKSFDENVHNLLGRIDKNLEVLLLGCTHYPLIAAKIEEVLQVQTICPTREVVDQLVRQLDGHSALDETKLAPASTFLYAVNDSDPLVEKTIHDFLFWDLA